MQTAPWNVEECRLCALEWHFLSSRRSDLAVPDAFSSRLDLLFSPRSILCETLSRETAEKRSLANVNFLPCVNHRRHRLTRVFIFLTTGTKLRRPFRSRFRHHGGFLLLCGEQKQRRQVGRDDVVRLLVEPEEVHSGDEDGLRWLEETARQSRFDRVLERKHQVTVNVFSNTHLISYTNTCSSPNINETAQKCNSLLSLSLSLSS